MLRQMENISYDKSSKDVDSNKYILLYLNFRHNGLIIMTLVYKNRQAKSNFILRFCTQ